MSGKTQMNAADWAVSGSRTVSPTRALIRRLVPGQRPRLHDMAGNVREWTSDWYGGTLAESHDPAPPQLRIRRKVIKGGSYLCADSYCMRYRPAARRPQMLDTGLSHIGFRCVLRADAS